MGIVQQVRSVVHVLRRSSAKGHILSKVCLGIDNFLAASSVVADIVEGHERVMLAGFGVSDMTILQLVTVTQYLPDIQRLRIFSVRVTFTICKRHVALHVGFPGDACQKISDKSLYEGKTRILEAGILPAGSNKSIILIWVVLWSASS